MGRAWEKLRLSRVLGVSTWAAMALFGVIRALGRRVPWDRWLELNEFLDSVLDRGGTLSRKDKRVAVEQRLDESGASMSAELRPGTSDFATWTQVAGLKEYGAVVRYLGAHSDHPVRTVLDAGANIGLASLYFACAFPDCRILALEPDPDNFRLLSHNVRGLAGRVECVEAAFWPVEEPLELDPVPFRGGREWARTVRRAGGGKPAGQPRAVRALTPAGARARLGGGGIDLLKMDIEGAEAAFFEDPERCRELLSGVEAIAVEVHAERMDPHAVVRLLDQAGFLVMPGREILVGLRRDRPRRT